MMEAPTTATATATATTTATAIAVAGAPRLAVSGAMAYDVLKQRYPSLPPFSILTSLSKEHLVQDVCSSRMLAHQDTASVCGQWRTARNNERLLQVRAEQSALNRQHQASLALNVELRQARDNKTAGAGAAAASATATAGGSAAAGATATAAAAGSVTASSGIVPAAYLDLAKRYPGLPRLSAVGNLPERQWVLSLAQEHKMTVADTVCLCQLWTLYGTGGRACEMSHPMAMGLMRSLGVGVDGATSSTEAKAATVAAAAAAKCAHCGTSKGTLVAAPLVSQHGDKWSALNESDKTWWCTSCDRLVAHLDALGSMVDLQTETAAALRVRLAKQELFAKVLAKPGWLESLQAGQRAKAELRRLQCN